MLNIHYPSIHILPHGLVEYPSGKKEWFMNGQRHREDGPAIEHVNGRKEWYLHGKLHRIDGPAIDDGGNTFWYLNGQRHNPNGPAIELADGYKSWWLNDLRHREDGPAIEDTNGMKSWCINGEFYGTNNDFTIQSWIHFQKSLLF